MASHNNDVSLPSGWIEQYDPGTGRNFYVDTSVEPPRVTWNHPYEDEQYLREHPEARGRVRERAEAPPLPYSGSPEIERRRSFAGTPSSPAVVPLRAGKPPQKRGFFAKLKDKAVNSMEAREERKRQEAAALRQRLQSLRQERFSSGTGYPGARYRASPGPSTPIHGGPPMMSGYPVNAQYYQYPPQFVQTRRRGGMGGGVALPLLGGLAGGMLLGDMLDGGLCDAGGFGGDFGGF